MALDAISSVARSAAGAQGIAAAGIGSTGGATGAGAVTGGELARGGSAPGGGFLDALGQALQGLNGQLTEADAAMADFAAGGSADLHTVMLEMQEASLGLKVGVQVRDRLLEAYQEIMRMQL